jgi:enoyl-CoA hydratase
MKPGLTIGQRAQLSWNVGAEHSIQIGADLAGDGAVVFATPAMISLMEYTALEALRPYLDDGEASVGVQLNVEHLAATPIAATVRAEAQVTAVDGRRVDFQVAAYDEAEQIGRGTHRRAVIAVDRFMARLADKTKNPSQGVLLTMPIQPNAGSLAVLKTLQVKQEGPIVMVTLNRPKQRNAVNEQMTADWEQLIAWLAARGGEARVVIVTGAGNAFCAGDDVKEVGTLSADAARQLSLRQARMYLALEELPQVTIAAVNGFALGGGCVCAYSCDFRIAASAARFGMPEILLGWPPGYGIAQLTALVGKARALELCLTGKQITAQQALQYALVHEVVPLSRLMPSASALAQQLLDTPPGALQETKRIIHRDEGLQSKIAYYNDTAAYIRCLQTADAREGIAAFMEKRAARFGTGR